MTEAMGIKFEQPLCVQITCDDKEGKRHYGTGVCFRTADPYYDLVITAGHCIPNVQPESIIFQGNDFTIVSIFLPNEYQKASAWDFGVIVIQKIPLETFAFTLTTKHIPSDTENYCLWGYPEKKRNTENPLNDVSAVFIRKNGNHQLVFKLEDSTGSADYSGKELLQGMSGGPIIYDSEIPSVCGIFTHTLLPDGAYEEVCFVELEHIINWMHQFGLIFFETGNPDCPCIYEPIVNGKWQQEKEKERISAILVGKSGAGKSAFAKTFLKNAAMFDATGQTRTTRSTIKYSVSLYCRIPMVHIQFFNKEDFINFRLKRCYEMLDAKYQSKLDSTHTFHCHYTQEPNNDIQNLPTLSLYNLNLSELSICTLANDAFFDYRELSYLDYSIEEKIKKTFETVFSNKLEILPKIYTNEEYISICRSLESLHKSEQNDEQDNLDLSTKSSQSEYTLDDVVTLLFEKIYELVMPAIYQRYNIKKTHVDVEVGAELELKLHELINNSLKVCKGNSLTGFVKAVTIEDRVSDEYIRCFQENDLHTLTLLDTYGLDHMAQLTTQALEQRLWELSSENTDANFIFYIRKLGTDAPSDLESIIPNIYTADPRFRVYTIFTGIDENKTLVEAFKSNDSKVLKLLEINKSSTIPAVNYFLEDDNGLVATTHPIFNALIASRVSKALSRNVYQSIRDHLVPYCASEDIHIRNHYLHNNVFHINELICSLINKDYLGKGFINLKYIEKGFTPGLQSETVKLKLMELLKKLFDLASIHWYSGISGTGHWRTKQANIDCLQRGQLGYSGTYNHQWNERFFSSYNKVFSKISEEDFNLLFSTDGGLNDATAIQQLINNFGKSFLGCRRAKEHFTFPLSNEHCKDCNTHNCFRSILLQAYKQGELTQNWGPSRENWLNNRCNFGERFEQMKDPIYNLFLKEFNRIIIPEARAHNARKAANLLNQNKDAMNYLEQIKRIMNELLDENEESLNNKRFAEILQEF